MSLPATPRAPGSFSLLLTTREKRTRRDGVRTEEGGLCADRRAGALPVASRQERSRDPPPRQPPPVARTSESSAVDAATACAPAGSPQGTGLEAFLRFSRVSPTQKAKIRDPGQGLTLGTAAILSQQILCCSLRRTGCDKGVSRSCPICPWGQSHPCWESPGWASQP